MLYKRANNSKHSDLRSQLCKKCRTSTIYL